MAAFPWNEETRRNLVELAVRNSQLLSGYPSSFTCHGGQFHEALKRSCAQRYICHANSKQESLEAWKADLSGIESEEKSETEDGIWYVLYSTLSPLQGTAFLAEHAVKRLFVEKIFLASGPFAVALNTGCIGSFEQRTDSDKNVSVKQMVTIIIAPSRYKTIKCGCVWKLSKSCTPSRRKLTRANSESPPSLLYKSDASSN